MGSNTTMKLLLAAGIIIVAVAAVMMLQLDEALVVFHTPAEAIAKSEENLDKKIRIGAMVKEGSVEWNADQRILKFILSDLRDTEIEVTHEGTPPDMFKEGAGVVVEGRLSGDGKYFASRKLIVKHSEEYVVPGEHTRLDPDEIRREILKNESLED